MSEHLTSMKKNDLYILIETLHPTEKKVFKEKYAAKADANFMRLFNAIAAGEVKNDTGAKIKFKNEKFTGHLGKAKSYLYEAILCSLCEQLQPQYARLQIWRKLELAETLYSRKMTEQAVDLLLEALKEAQQYEEFESEEFVLWLLANMAPKLHLSQRFLNNAVAAREKVSDYRVFCKFFLEVHEAYLQRGKKDAADLKVFSESPLLSKKQKTGTARSCIMKEATQSLLQTVSFNYNEASESNFRIVQLSKPLASVSSGSEIGYINSIFNAVLSMQSCGEPATDLMNELEQFNPVSKWAISHRFICLTRLRLNAYLSGKGGGEGKRLLKLIEGQMPQHVGGFNEPELIKLHISIAALCLKEKEYHRALDYLLLFNRSKIAREKMPVIYRVAMVYQLIANYQLENFEWLAGALRNYKYYQQTNSSFYIIEKHTLEFLSKAIHLTTARQRTEAKKLYEKNLLAFAGAQNSGLAYLRHIDWMG